jgi:predicted Zn-dependent protease
LKSLPRTRASRWLAAFLAASMLSPPALGPAAAQNRLPALGDQVSDAFSVGTERKLGDEIMREIRRDRDYLDDPVLLEYIQSLWQPLVAAGRSRGDIESELDQRFAWETFLVRDRSVNAFALPGGFVGVHLGLIAMTATRDELASVLAHEMSHVTQRHIARGLVNSKRQSILSAAAMIVGVIAASRSNRADGANAVLAGGQALAAQGQLNFSRDMEREADRIGFAVLSSAGFAPGGMAAMFEKLDQSSRLNDSGGFPYLRSHPLSTERVGEARARANAAAPVRPVGVLEHAVAQARARVLMDTSAAALQRLQGQAADAAAPAPEQLSAAYVRGLASSLLRDWARADEAIAQAQALVRGSPRGGGLAERNVALLAVESQLQRGNAARAAELLAPYTDLASEARPVLLLVAQAALAGRERAELQRSADELQTWTSLHPADAAAWLVLASTWGQMGFKLRALRAEAESRIALGDYTGAVDRLRAGQRAARGPRTADFIEASVIDARLRDIERLRREAERPE